MIDLLVAGAGPRTATRLAVRTAGVAAASFGRAAARRILVGDGACPAHDGPSTTRSRATAYEPRRVS